MRGGLFLALLLLVIGGAMVAAGLSKRSRRILDALKS